MDNKTIHLKDYKPSHFTVDTISLLVDIQSDKTLVTSELKLFKRKDLHGTPQTLELSGENMKLISIHMNGEILESSKFQLSNDKLVILNLASDELTLKIQNEIDPAHNTACEGFYKSGEQYCTQCEPEGFRKITYFIDRPDVMAKFKTRMEGDKQRFPFLLSNGNRIAQGDLPGGRHFMEWEDPFRKPAYLFAMVAGDFDVARDTFTTMKGRKVALEIYVDKGNLKKTPHAMQSLKHSMKWDEDTFGLEYDLDIYMIVAVDSFNMGAMENKGLNIFNSTFTLADEKSATDVDFQNIQGVIGHEYFHNWTGNRVTCRDWFQLTLKEGLTVYRDQEFSSDMLSRAVKRVEDVKHLKEAQFAEDAGPLSHPIRPSSYIEINNFYTLTVYEKGAEVIRMIETLIGKEKFRKGMDKYFELYDGQAVTTEDFVHAMELASGRDLTQFKNWYSRPGTPTLAIKKSISGSEMNLEIEQRYPPTTLKVPEGNVLAMPFRVAILNQDGSSIEKKLEITKLKESFKFPYAPGSILSLNRGFSAPVNVDFDYGPSELLHLMGNDSDFYCRYEATQRVYDSLFKAEFKFFKDTGKLNLDLDPAFKAAFTKLLSDHSIDLSFKSYLLGLPTENALSQEILHPDFEAIQMVLDHLKRKLGVEFHDWFLNEHQNLSKPRPFDLTPEGYGVRALKNQCLSFLVSSESQVGLERLHEHYSTATNMTEELRGLSLFIKSGIPLGHPVIQKFYNKWKGDSLVMLKWFGALASSSPKEDVIERLEALEKDALFDKNVPNYLRSLYGQFAKGNLVGFHSLDGNGYRFVADRIKKIDSYNPQVASRTASAFSLINRLDPVRQKLMKGTLEELMTHKTSRDTFEVISKYLAQ